MQESDSTQKNRVAGLDLLRAVAILLVFCWHFQGTGGPASLEGISRYGWTGVDLFFVLSGYLIASQLFKAPRNSRLPSLKTFYIKRSFRILPSYLLVLALYFFIPAWNEGHGLAALWRYLSFTQNFGLDRGQANGFSHAWSLCVEEHFYLLLPALVLLIFKNKSRLNLKVVTIALPIFLFFSGMLLRAILWLKYIAPHFQDPNYKPLANLFDKVIYYPTYTRLDGLIVGVSIAMLFSFNTEFKKKLAQYTNVIAGIAFVFLVLGLWLTADRLSFRGAVLGYPFFSLGYGALVMSAALGNSWLFRYPVPAAKKMAMLAFTFYLTHKEIIRLTQPWLEAHGILHGTWKMLFLVFLLCLAVSQVMHTLIEEPFLKLRDRVLMKRARSAPSIEPFVHDVELVDKLI